MLMFSVWVHDSDQNHRAIVYKEYILLYINEKKSTCVCVCVCVYVEARVGIWPGTNESNCI